MQFRWHSAPYNRWKTRASGFPKWGMPLLAIAAIPGAIIALLSIVLLVTSLLALLLLTLPVFYVIVWVSGGGKRIPRTDEAPMPSPGSKPIDVRITDG